MNEAEAIRTDGVTVELRRDQRAWLLREAATRAVELGGRASVSRVVRELIDVARGESRPARMRAGENA
jgi:hypothetical protein